MRIVAAIPLGYVEGAFWHRDLGLIVRALRAAGHQATFAALGDEGAAVGEKPLILLSRQKMADPAWWQAQRAEGIILNTWSATRFEDIRTAALSAGCPLIEKLDTDGIKSPRLDWRLHLGPGLVDYDRRASPLQKMRVMLRAVAHTAVVYAFPALLDERMVRGMSRVPLYAAETPVATARVRRFLQMYRADPMPRVVTVPHPVDTTHMGLGEGIRKQRRVIAVGRWNDAVKGWPMLAAVAGRFLGSHPEWKVLVAGSGAEAEGAALAAQWPGRFEMAGHLDHARLSRHLQEARIFLLPSHFETFNIAGAEALCCGCSVVGPARIPSSGYFAGKSSGTVSHRRSAVHLSDALAAEAEEWERGRRDPAAISRAWLEELSAETVARQYLQLFEQLRAAGTPTRPTP